MSAVERAPDTLTGKRLARTTNAAAGALENVLIKGDLGKLNDEQRIQYYARLCDSVGLNPLTQPFEYLTLSGKLVLYAKRSCTDQLRAIHGVSVVDMDEQDRDGVYIVTVKVCDKNGRSDMAKGAVKVAGLSGDNLANAIMKAETKAKRRATLSICGLGLLDELEIETIPGASPAAPTEAAGGAPTPRDPPPRQRRSNVVVNPATGKEIDTENARNQRPEWQRFADTVQGYVDARDADGLKAWFAGDKIAEFVAGWVFKDSAQECFDDALERIAELERA